MTAAWLAPDGRPWGERERGQGVPMALSLGYLGLVQYRPNRTSMAWAADPLPGVASGLWPGTPGRNAGAPVVMARLRHDRKKETCR